MADTAATPTDALYACLGIESLGSCSYNPADPTVYFGVGGAIAALGFILAVQQLLRPVYRFRLEVRAIHTKGLYALVFSGLLAVFIAALLPSFPLLHGGPLSFPIVWEIIAAGLFATAYGAITLAIVKPVGVRRNRVIRFVKSSAWLLSSATERDFLDFAEDLEQSLPALIKTSAFAEVRGPASAFWIFKHREALERASYARSLLRIMADPVFCGVLVKGAPWQIATALNDVAARELHSRGSEPFVRELAKQAILREDSMMAREMGYQGFATAPFLSDSLFARNFIVRFFDPLDSLQFIDRADINAGVIRRFNEAAEKALTTVIESRSLWGQQVVYSIEQCYERIFQGAWCARGEEDFDQFPVLEMHNGVDLAIKMANKLLQHVEEELVDDFYLDDLEESPPDTLDSLVNIVSEALLSISNDFKGFEDRFWILAIQAFGNAFPSIGDQPSGMTPFQQRLALRLIRGLRQNMDGLYPALSRVLLACIGPYESRAQQTSRTAFMILRDAMYKELQRLPELAAKKLDKVSDYLPDNVTYNFDSNELTHTYSGGRQAVTNLTDLHIEQSSLKTADVAPGNVM